MSKIALSGNPSGTGTFTIASPNSNTDTSITLPAITGGEFIVSNASGNVGIGTSSPADKLDVNGVLRLSGTPTTPQTGTGSLFNASGIGAAIASFQFAVFTGNDNSRSERMRVTEGGDLRFNSGYGSVATAYGCRAWVNFNGNTATPSTIRSAGNVSSVTRNNTGDYTVNFATAMPDANYCVSATAQETVGDDGAWARAASVDALTTTSVTVFTFDMRDSVATAQQHNVDGVHVVIHR